MYVVDDSQTVLLVWFQLNTSQDDATAPSTLQWVNSNLVTLTNFEKQVWSLRCDKSQHSNELSIPVDLLSVKSTEP